MGGSALLPTELQVLSQSGSQEPAGVTGTLGDSKQHLEAVRSAVFSFLESKESHRSLSCPWSLLLPEQSKSQGQNIHALLASALALRALATGWCSLTLGGETCTGN